MDMWIAPLWIIGVVVGLVLIIVISKRLIKAHKARQQAKRAVHQSKLDDAWIRTLETLAEKGGLAEAPDPPRTFRRSYTKEVLVWINRINEARNIERAEEVHRHRRDKLDVIMAIVDDEKRRVQLVEFGRRDLADGKFSTELDELTRLTEEHASELYQTVVEENDTTALLLLIDFTSPRVNAYRSSRDREASWFRAGTGKDYREPTGWQDLVANLMENPVLSDFRLPHDPWPSGQYILEAAAALREQSLTKAKIILAYAKQYPQYREEIGNFAEQLAKFVDAVHASRSRASEFESPVE